MSEWKAKRFWKAAQAVGTEGGFTVELDGRPIRTPAKQPVLMPTRALADAVAEEWAAQDDMIVPDTMPVTKTVNSAIDKVIPQQAEVVDMLAEYGDSDLLCYRADAPEALIKRQAAAWDPLLDWAAQAFDVRLVPRTGVMHAPQDADALARLHKKVAVLDPFTLAAFHDLVSLSGSIIIGFAALETTTEAGELWEVSRLDEVFQAEQWGKDDAAEAATAIRRDAFLQAHRIAHLARENTVSDKN